MFCENDREVFVKWIKSCSRILLRKPLYVQLYGRSSCVKITSRKFFADTDIVSPRLLTNTAANRIPSSNTAFYALAYVSAFTFQNTEPVFFAVKRRWDQFQTAKRDTVTLCARLLYEKETRKRVGFNYF